MHNTVLYYSVDYNDSRINFRGAMQAQFGRRLTLIAKLLN